MRTRRVVRLSLAAASLAVLPLLAAADARTARKRVFNFTYAGTVSRSFAEGSELLERLADLSVSAKHVERLTRRIGAERVAERDAEVAAYQALPLVEKFAVPAGATAPDLAVVMADGARLQILDRARRPPADPLPQAAAAAERAPAPAEDAAWEEEPTPSGH